MPKTILITGATDGIGLETSKTLVEHGHHVLLHGRNVKKLKAVEETLSAKGTVESYVADLSNLDAVKQLAQTIKGKHKTLDVLVNNAGILKTPNTTTSDGLDVRFVVNTISPYLLTKELLAILGNNGRVINLSSAAQSPVKLDALTGKDAGLDDMDAYSQSKLAITMWSRSIANSGPTVIAVNPGSLLGSKMVKEGFGISGKDIGIGAEILVRLALEEEFSNASGQYFDNDKGQFGRPHPDALDDHKCAQIVQTIEELLSSRLD